MGLHAIEREGQGLSIEEAVEAIWETIEKNEYEAVSQSVRALWETLDLADDAREELARQGLINITLDRQIRRRQLGRPPIVFGRPHGRNWAPYMVTLSTPYEDESGRQRSLLDFRVGDLHAMRLRDLAESRAAAKRAKWSLRVENLLAEYEVEVVRDLPAAVLEDVAARFQEVFA